MIRRLFAGIAVVVLSAAAGQPAGGQNGNSGAEACSRSPICN
jgi:hypothetical protein